MVDTTQPEYIPCPWCRSTIATHADACPLVQWLLEVQGDQGGPYKLPLARDLSKEPQRNALTRLDTP